MAGSGALHPDLTWNFSQVFGDKAGEGVEIAEADIISAVEFNHDGEYLATGDKGGRVVLFERNNSGMGSESEFRFFTEFQSHEPEFDYLKSLEIEEKINQIKWLPRRNHAHFLITTNDKTIKLWKVSNRPYFVDRDAAVEPEPGGGIKVPVMQAHEDRTEARAKRVFANAHAYHINSISVNSDDETFISADDLRINLWNLGVNDQSFNIVDIKPAMMEELTEVITAARFHPQHCNIFMYSSSKGAVKICDMRAAALCDRHAKSFEEPLDPKSRSFFSEIIASTSDVQFSNSGEMFLSRDYLSIKVWDTRMEKAPVQAFDVHDFLRPKLCDLYENDCIFDKFDACWARDDRQILAGSYHNLFRMYNLDSGENACFEASRDNIMGPMHTLQTVDIISGQTPRTSRQQIHVEDIDFNFKILHAAWHPNRDILALAATNNLYLYHR